jgi:hypothetical protein
MQKMSLFWVLACAGLAAAQPALRYKVALPSEDKAAARPAVGRLDPGASNSHLVIEFAGRPDAAQIGELRARGVQVLAHVPDHGVLVAVRGAVDLSGMGIVAAGPLPAAVKISPLLEPGAAEMVVEFHPDVNLNEARGLVLALGFSLQENPDLGAQRLLLRRQARTRGADSLRALAARDEVAYIFPASAELVRGIPVAPCASAVTELGMLGQYIATVGEGWDGPGRGAAALNYVWGAPTSKLPASQVWAEVQRAMQEWSKVAAIRWSPGVSATAPRTIHVLFGAGHHGDAYAFDGPGGVLAHTFYPAPPNPEPIAGDMHLDEDEAWKVGANVDLFSVALHELGHALGLAHSDDPNAVMYPYYRMAATLQSDDRNAVLRLYAAASAAPPAPTPEPAPAPTPPAAPAPSDTTAPTLRILNPMTSNVLTSAPTRQISGTAWDNVGVERVSWENSLGGAGAATGTASWSASIPLHMGINRVTVRAWDAAGNMSWQTVIITRR